VVKETKLIMLNRMNKIRLWLIDTIAYLNLIIPSPSTPRERYAQARPNYDMNKKRNEEKEDSDNSQWTLMTKDHRHPKSKGGQDTLENLDPMCTVCNGKKGDKI